MSFAYKQKRENKKKKYEELMMAIKIDSVTDLMQFYCYVVAICFLNPLLPAAYRSFRSFSFSLALAIH